MMMIATSVTKTSQSTTNTDKAYCERLASQMRYEDLPAACHAYHAKKLSATRRPTDPFAGMNAGASIEARRALSEKRESHAQIQRRMTSLNRR